MRIRVCPCGARLEQKAYESQAQFEKRKYCGCACKGKYHRDQSKEKGFGLLVPKNKTGIRAGKGFHRYLDARAILEFEA